LQCAIVAARFPDFASDIKLKYSGEDEPFISPPCKELKSNPSTPNDDSNSMYNEMTRSLWQKIKEVLGKRKRW